MSAQIVWVESRLCPKRAGSPVGTWGRGKEGRTRPRECFCSVFVCWAWELCLAGEVRVLRFISAVRDVAACVFGRASCGFSAPCTLFLPFFFFDKAVGSSRCGLLPEKHNCRTWRVTAVLRRWRIGFCRAPAQASFARYVLRTCLARPPLVLLWEALF